jgi:hypothetical protein
VMSGPLVHIIRNPCALCKASPPGDISQLTTLARRGCTRKLNHPDSHYNRMVQWNDGDTKPTLRWPGKELSITRLWGSIRW